LDEITFMVPERSEKDDTGLELRCHLVVMKDYCDKSVVRGECFSVNSKQKFFEIFCRSRLFKNKNIINILPLSLKTMFLKAEGYCKRSNLKSVMKKYELRLIQTDLQLFFTLEKTSVCGMGRN